MTEVLSGDDMGTPLPTTTEPSGLLALAIEQNASVESLEKLLALQERWDREQARKAYYAARTQFQAMQPPIAKSKQISFNRTEYSYAPLGEIAEQIRETLAACGLSYRFEQNHTDGITVTCIVSHVDGHSESTAMDGPPDTSGSKNSIQSIGSTVTYLQRYTLISALGLTTADQDTDGIVPDEPITDDQAAALKARLAATGSDVKKFCALLAIDSVDAMPSRLYAQADKVLTQKEAKAVEAKG